ncbi:MAG: T9SS type A sorting domain-containing protein [Chitinophagales bacterium]
MVKIYNFFNFYFQTNDKHKWAILACLMWFVSHVAQAQNINLEVDVYAAGMWSVGLYGSNCGNNDCGVNEPDPRIDIRVRHSGTGTYYGTWQNYRDGYACNNYSLTYDPANYTANNIGNGNYVYLELTAYEPDNALSGGADANCGGYGTIGNQYIRGISPCTWNARSDYRDCASDNVTERWRAYWQWRWSWCTTGLSGTTAAGVIGGNQLICSGGNPSTLTNSTTATYMNGSFYIQRSINGAAWTNVTGASTSTTLTYDEGVLSTIGCYRYRRIQQFCGGASVAASTTQTYASNEVGIIVFPTAPTITTPSNVCQGTSIPAPTVPSYTNFGVQYSINNGAYTSWSSPTTPGCYYIRARYIYTPSCGPYGANQVSPCISTNTVYVTVFPDGPTITAPSNVCAGTLISLPSVAAVSGFSVQYRVDGGTWLAAGSVNRNLSAGCHTVQARYVLTSTCGGTAAGASMTCAEGNVVNVTVFPQEPTISTPSSVCAGTSFTLPSVTSVSGFTTQYSINGGTWSSTPTIPTTAGCHSIQARYILASACGGTAAGTNGMSGCTVSNTVYATVFPQEPTLTAPANVCAGTSISLPSVPAVSGFSVQYSVNGGAWAVAPTIPTTAGCHSIRARYVLTSACGSLGAGSAGPSGCTESSLVYVTVFPTAPSLANPSAVCEGSTFTLPSVTAVSGFTVQYSIDGGIYSASPTIPTTAGCHSIRARYVLTSACGGTAANATGPAGCTESAYAYVATFPTPPTITAPANVCVGSAFTLPSVPAVSGFTVVYSIDGGAWSASPTIPTTVGTHTVRASYTINATCGATAAGTLSICAASNTVNAVVDPEPTATANYVLYTCDRTAQLTATGITPGATVSWQYVSGPTNPTGTTSSNPLLVTFSTAGTGVYNLLVSHGACSNINVDNVNMVMPTTSSTTLATTASCGYCVVTDGQTRSFYNSSGELIATIQDDPLVTPAALDESEVCVRMDATVQSITDNYGLQQPYLQRQWTVHPTTSTNAFITLYFTNAELVALQTAANSTPYQFSGYALNVTKYPGGSGGTFTAPGSPGGVHLPATFSAYGANHRVQVETNTFSTLYIHPSLFPFSVLPVELISFSGWNEGVVNKLNWTTASEKNTLRFEIEKSTNNAAWTYIGEKAAAGNSNAELQYDFTDNNPLVGNNYYRLKIFDIDGSFKYSNVINVPVSEVVANTFGNIYPNPTGGTLNVEIQATHAFDTKLLAYDVLGKQIFEQDAALVKGVNTLKLDFTSLAKGTYLLQFVDDAGNKHISKFVKN